MTTNVSESATAELRAVAARKRVTQTELAIALDRPAMWVGRRLRGVVPMTLDEFAAMCEALGETPVVRVAGPPDHLAALEAERFGVHTRG